MSNIYADFAIARQHILDLEADAAKLMRERREAFNQRNGKHFEVKGLLEIRDAQARTIERRDEDVRRLVRERDEARSDAARHLEGANHWKQQHDLLLNSRDHKDKTDAYVAGRQAARRDILGVIGSFGYSMSPTCWASIDCAVPPEEKRTMPEALSRITPEQAALREDGKQEARQLIIAELLKWGFEVDGATRGCVDRAVPPAVVHAAKPGSLVWKPKGAPCPFGGCLLCQTVKPTPRPPQPPLAGERFLCPYCTVELKTKPFLAGHMTACGLRPHPRG